MNPNDGTGMPVRSPLVFMLGTVFISSSSGLVSERQAAAAAVGDLGFDSDLFEKWTALSEAPEPASLAAVRESDLFVILLGARYGSPASTGRSIIHDEYLTARTAGIPVLAFRIDDGEPEQRQREFIAAIEQNEIIRAVTSLDDLKDQVRKAITQELVRQRAPERSESASRDVHLAAERRSFITIDLQAEEIEHLRDAVTKHAATNLNEMRLLFRGGRVNDAIRGLKQEIENPAWKRIAGTVRGRILATLATFELGVGATVADIEPLLREAQIADPDADYVYLATLIRYEYDGAEAALKDLESVAATNTLNLKLAFLLDLGRLADAAGLLRDVPSAIELDAETERLRAFLTWEQGDAEGALRVIGAAVRSDPASEALRLAQALIAIASTIAAEERPRHIGLWFEPIDPSFVVTMPEMLERLETAAGTLDDLLRHSQRKGTMLRQMQAWRLAALALHPARRDAARAFAALLLKDDPANPPALVWSLAYDFDIALDPAIAAVSAAPDPSDRAQRTIAVVAALVRRGEPSRADALLEESGALFPGEAADLWKYWKVRMLSAGARRDEALGLAKTIGDVELRQVAHRLIMEHQAHQTGDWDELLQLLDASGSSYDRLIMRARLGRWEEIVDPALSLVEKEPTPVAVKLGATALFHLRRHGESLHLLRKYSALTSSSTIAHELDRLAVENQIVIGESQEGLRAAEFLFKATSSGRDLLLTIRASIVAGRQKDASFWASRLLDLPAGQVSAAELLRISRMVTAEDRQLARRLWIRAKQLGFPDDALVDAMDRAFALGLDDEGTRLAVLLQQQASPDSGAFRAVSLDQLIEMEQSRQEVYAETWRMYAAGDIPLALLLARSRVPLAFVYEMQLANAQKQEIGATSPLYVRHGGRILTTDPSLETTTTLTVDVSTLLLADQLGVLDGLERRFVTIRVSPQACIALVEQQDRLQSAQPAADDAYALIHRMVVQGKIAETQAVVPTGALAALRPELGPEWTALIQAAMDADGFLVDHLPVRSWDGQREVELPAEIRSYVRQPKEVSGETASASKRDKLFLSDAVAFEFAYGEVLTHVSERFSVFVGRNVIAQARDRVETRQFRDALSARLGKLAARIGEGFATGKYRTFPASDRKADELDDCTMAALVDFVGADAPAQHAFVVDDRLVSSQLEREGSPVITLPDVLAELRRSDELSEVEYFSILLRLRRANYRFIDLNGNEIVYWLMNAAIADGAVQESEELRILRVYLNAALSDRNLRVAPLSLTTASGAIGEGAFGLNAAFAVNRALAAIWSLPDISDVDRRAFSDWILRNLYTGTYGSHHLYGGFNKPRLLMVTDLADLLTPVAAVLDEDGFNFERGEAFVAWTRRRIVDRRLDVDPDLLEDVARGINEHLWHTANEPLGRELIHAIYYLLPPRVTAAGASEAEFARSVDLKVYNVRSIAGHQFEEEQFWEAIERLQTDEEVTLRSNDEGLDVRVRRAPPEMRRGLIFEAKSGKKLFPNETFVVLAFDPPERQREYLQQHPEIFDEHDSALDASIDALLSLPTFRERLAHVGQLEKDSVGVFYERLRDSLGRVEMGIGDLMPAVAPLVRHYVPGYVPKTSLDVHAAFAPLLERGDLLEALRRAVVLPVSLPPELRARFLAERENRRREILRELLAEAESPVSYAHVTVLAFASGSDDDRQLAWRIIDHLLDTMVSWTSFSNTF